MAMDPDRKAEQTIRRLCKKNPRTGKRKVSDAVAKQFFSGGKARKDLIALFMKNGGKKESRYIHCLFQHVFHLYTKFDLRSSYIPCSLSRCQVFTVYKSSIDIYYSLSYIIQVLKSEQGSPKRTIQIPPKTHVLDIKCIDFLGSFFLRQMDESPKIYCMVRLSQKKPY